MKFFIPHWNSSERNTCSSGNSQRLEDVALVSQFSLRSLCTKQVDTSCVQLSISLEPHTSLALKSKRTSTPYLPVFCVQRLG